MDFKENLKKGKFVVTVEIGPPILPPKGINCDNMWELLEPIKRKIDAVGVTDLKSSVMRTGGLSISHLLKERGFEPIFFLSCRDRNRLALQADLLSAWILGIKNVAILTGDHPSAGDYPQAKPVFDLDSIQLITVVKGFNEGYDMNRDPIDGRTDFFIGATVNPSADSKAVQELEFIKMEKKIQAGAQYFLTQPIFDIQAFNEFMERAKQFKVPIIDSVMPLKSASMARFLNKNVAGIFIPENLIEEMEKATDRQKTGIQIAVRIIQQLKDLCQGVYIMPVGWEKFLPQIITEANI